DLGFRAAGVSFLAMCEKQHDRAALAQVNFPEARVYARDIEEAMAPLCQAVAEHLARAGQELFLLSCTAPCQGMSKNGKGTLLSNVRKGIRLPLDPRNRLILPALRVVQRLRPRWVVFENVIEMRNTVIEDEQNEVRFILDVVSERLAPDYAGQAYEVEFADYAIPQRRQRLITVFTRDALAREHFESGLPLVPPPTHAKSARQGLLRWVTVTEALKDFPPLDPIDEAHATCPSIPFHRVPVLDPKKYEWIRNTPPGKSAFDNQCVNPSCLFQGNRVHGASHGADGINRAHRDTPLYCQECGALLPRPYTLEGGRMRLMSGYTSAYKRMDPGLPAPALTRNLSYPCSDQKLHPTQNRVLSLAEAMRIHTLDRYDYKWGPLEYANGGRKKTATHIAPDSLVRLVIGESVPPLFFELLGKHILGFAGASALTEYKQRPHRRPVQRTLW
ncbi:MAG TPA: DNA cytosine methyltransferase, partial [Gemmataceae bacterium]|nr:DNA cytosine methyltransferase [Gemmataceae bacterium]